jgi:hypothetical protein
MGRLGGPPVAGEIFSSPRGLLFAHSSLKVSMGFAFAAFMVREPVVINVSARIISIAAGGTHKLKLGRIAMNKAPNKISERKYPTGIAIRQVIATNFK